jgi:hypothetical protein
VTFLLDDATRDEAKMDTVTQLAVRRATMRTALSNQLKSKANAYAEIMQKLEHEQSEEENNEDEQAVT